MKKDKAEEVVLPKQTYDELFLQPWFLPKPIYLEMRRLLSSSQLQKMRFYLNDYGRLKCGSRSTVYGNNGMCKRCNIVVRSRIIVALKKRFRQIGIEVGRRPIREYLARLQSL
jgi:hypothetical protein